MDKININNKLRKFLEAHKFGEDLADNYGGVNEYFKTDQKRFNDAKIESLQLLKDLKYIYKREIVEACNRAFSGRLEYKNNCFHYTAGQFYDLEVPQAIRAVLEYVRDHRE